MADWKYEYQKKLVSAEEAAAMIKSGDSIVCTAGREPLSIGLALAARKEELQGVTVLGLTPTFDFGWFDAGWEQNISAIVGYVFPKGIAREAMDNRICDYAIGGMRLWYYLPELRVADVILTEVSPPDEHGFCSFGASVYDKRRWVRCGKKVLAEVNLRLIRTYGDNFIHVSQIDHFVEHQHTGREPGLVDLSGRPVSKPPEYVKTIAGYVSQIIKDGDTIQIGTGGTSESLVREGLLDNKNDIGWHSEVTPGGIIRLVREGIITGKYKTIDSGKTVATAIGGGTKEEMEFVNLNPMFELRDAEYTHDPRVISRLDNMVAINNALAVDLTGQVSAESIGIRMYSGAGGLLAFSIGAALSKGGRSIIVLPSTARGGSVSTIVSSLEEGTVVTVPRILTDMVATEYGIAYLKGKTQRERAEQLINIAHPDFRPELRREARKLFWP